MKASHTVGENNLQCHLLTLLLAKSKGWDFLIVGFIICNQENNRTIYVKLLLTHKLQYKLKGFFLLVVVEKIKCTYT